jgi:NitT/TauT family transport system substrate-binding protein
MKLHRSLCKTLAFLALMAWVTLANGEVSRVRVAMQFGLTYLPIMIMQEDHLIEKSAKAAGLGDVEVQWHKFSGGNVMNDALLSGNLDFAATGPPSFLILWDKASSSLDVKGIASYGATPLYLVTRNTNVRTIKDFSDKDRIALPAVKSSVQAIILQMAAEKEWGVGNHGRLDGFTVSRSHADAVIAMMSPSSEINGHFAAPPYAQQELAQPGFRLVLKANEAFGGPFSNGIIYTTSKFRNDNPKTIAAFVDALRESIDYMKKDPRGAAQKYLKMTGDKMSVDEVLKIITDPDADWTVVPQQTFTYATFMHRIGSIKREAKSWKDLFFPEAHALAGS